MRSQSSKIYNLV